MEIMCGDYVLLCLESKFIACSIACPSFDAGTSKPGGEAGGVVVAAVGAGLKHWHSAELGSKHDECGF